MEGVEEGTPFTREARKESQTEKHKSAISDHVAQENHTINWDSTRIVMKEPVEKTRWMKEAIQIRWIPTMNRDEGNYHLSHLFDDLLRPATRD